MLLLLLLLVMAVMEIVVLMVMVVMVLVMTHRSFWEYSKALVIPRLVQRLLHTQNYLTLNMWLVLIG